MGRLLRTADRLLLNPWTSRWGGVQAIIGAGVLVAGLVGGTVSLVFGFSSGWAILTAAGAFLVFATVAASILDHYRQVHVQRVAATPLSDGETEVRKASGWIIEDLENARSILEASVENRYWWDRGTRKPEMFGWSEYGDAIFIHGHQQEHKNVRKAVRLIDQAEIECRQAWDGVGSGPGIRPVVLDAGSLEQAIEAIRVAERDLERICQPT